MRFVSAPAPSTAARDRLAAGADGQPAPMTMAEGCPPRCNGLPTLPVASVTGMTEPACCVTQATDPSAVRAMPWAAFGRAIAGPTARPSAFTVTGTTPAPPQT